MLSAEVVGVRRVPIRPLDPVLLGVRQAEILREAHLRPELLEDPRPLIVDLRAVRALSLGATESLVIPWLLGAPVFDGVRTPVAFELFSRVDRDILESALRRARLLGFWKPAAPGGSFAIELIGDATPDEHDAYELVRQEGPTTEDRLARDLARHGLAVSPSRLLERGALTRFDNEGSTILAAPFAVPVLQYA